MEQRIEEVLREVLARVRHSWRERDQQIEHAPHQPWRFSRATNELAWDVYPAEGAYLHYHLSISLDSQRLAVTHGNRTAGIWRTLHAIRRATLIPLWILEEPAVLVRLDERHQQFGAMFGRTPLAPLLEDLFTNQPPDFDWPT